MTLSAAADLPLRRLPRRLPVKAVVLQAAGFLAIACTVWLDELVDLPHNLLGAPASPFRPHEAILESGLVLLLGAAIVLFTIRLARHADRLIVLCAWCHRTRVDNVWASIEEFMRVHRAETSHGMCPDCAARFDAEIVGAA
ncbi:MAG: hypothetical protein ACREMS_07345 [Gemmatimonadaceae bacterium]